MRPDRVRFADYPVLDDGRGKRWMTQAGKVLRVWMAVSGLVAGLQSACIPARSDDLRGIETPAGEARFQPALLVKDVAGHARGGFVIQVSETSPEKEEPSADTQVSEVSAEKEEVSAERERDHGARSPQEMLAWFLKGAALLTAMVLFYKGLKWWVLRKRQSE